MNCFLLWLVFIVDSKTGQVTKPTTKPVTVEKGEIPQLAGKGASNVSSSPKKVAPGSPVHVMSADDAKLFWRSRQEGRPTEKKAPSVANRPPVGATKSEAKSSSISSLKRKEKRMSRSVSPSSSTIKDKPSAAKSPDRVKANDPEKKKGSQKWFHFRKSHRSKSVSPERLPGATSKPSSSVVTKNHPLVVASSASTEALHVADVKRDTETNVMDRVKQYNVKDAAVSSNLAATGGGRITGAGSASFKPEAMPKGDKSSLVELKDEKRDDTAVKKVKKKGKRGEKMAKDKKKSKKAGKKKDPSSSRSWNPFRSHKSTGAKGVGKTTEGGNKRETDLNKESEAMEVGRTEQFGGVRQRIEKLKEQGLATDGTDGSDGELLNEDNLDSCEVDSNSSSGESEDEESSSAEGEEESEEEDVAGIADDADITPNKDSEGPDQEVHLMPPGNNPSTENGSEGCGSEESEATVNVREHVMKYQVSMERSPVTVKRAQSLVEGLK